MVDVVRQADDDADFDPEAELLFLADELPELTSELRTRVVGASLSAHSSSRFWHRFQATTTIVLFLAATATLNAYYSTLLHKRISAHAQSPSVFDTGGPFAPAASVLARGTRQLSSGGATPEWALVDASVASRRQTFRILQWALWD